MPVNVAILLRLSGAAALIGGALRIGAAFPLPLTPIGLEACYDAIDVLLLLGLIGIYLVRAETHGLLGLAAFAVAVAALSFIGGPDADTFGFSTYQEGATALAIALAGLSIAWVRAGARPFAPPLLWFASIVAAGALMQLPAPLPSHGLTAAGVLFGSAFMAAGLDLMRHQRFRPAVTGR